MPRRLSYTEKARDDLDEMRRWLTQPGSGSAARQRMAAILADIRRLKLHPCLHPVVHHPVRELPRPGGYRALYRVAPDTGVSATAGDVRVLRVYGPGRDRSSEPP